MRVPDRRRRWCPCSAGKRMSSTLARGVIRSPESEGDLRVTDMLNSAGAGVATRGSLMTWCLGRESSSTAKPYRGAGREELMPAAGMKRERSAA